MVCSPLADVTRYVPRSFQRTWVINMRWIERSSLPKITSMYQKGERQTARRPQNTNSALSSLHHNITATEMFKISPKDFSLVGGGPFGVFVFGAVVSPHAISGSGLGLRIFSLLGQTNLDGKRMKLENSFKHIYQRCFSATELRGRCIELQRLARSCFFLFLLI